MDGRFGAGTYARAAGPVAATVKHTAERGLVTFDGTIDRGDVGMPFYAAHPELGDGWPIVLILSEAFGLHEPLRDVARRFARAGYLAVAPDLMLRQGDPLAFSDVDALVRDLLLEIPDAQVMADLDACADWAVAYGGDAERLNVTGFCWGGRWTWLYAAKRALHAAVVWYGILDGIASGAFPADPVRFPKHPIDVAGELRTPVLGLYGGRDTAIPVATVNEMLDRLASGPASAKRSEIVIFPDAGHAFFADYRDTFDADAAAGAWSCCLQWLARPPS